MIIYSRTFEDMSREVATDNEDGTGVIELFDPDGTLISSQPLSLPLPAPIEPSELETMRAEIAELQEALRIALGGPA